MKRIVTLAMLATVMFSCQKQDMPAEEPVSQDVLTAIGKAGFSKQGVVRTEGGYIVEGDIFIDDNHLRAQPQWGTVTIANVEQYRTNALVSVSGSRTITVSISNRLPSSYVAALDEALARYNAEPLTLEFRRISGNADIDIVSGNGSFLASAGFPSNGNPFGTVRVNSRAIGSQPRSTVATILAHEIGHCIGFRHTDYMDRSFSCGGAPTDEGQSTVGAILIPGTPAGPDAGSWMLACIGSGQNRPFNNNDKTALAFLY